MRSVSHAYILIDSCHFMQWNFFLHVQTILVCDNISRELFIKMTNTLMRYVPGLPTTKRMSAISSLLNIAAFLSLTVGLEACQLGSTVDWPGQVKLKDVLVKLGDASGDVGALAGCVICIASRCEMLWGGERDRPPLFGVSAVTKEQWQWKYIVLITVFIAIFK
jgi:hypothetical protein